MAKKIGRNQKCVCGSGLKYKMCCLRRTLEVKSVDIHTERYNVDKILRNKDLIKSIKSQRLYSSKIPISECLNGSVVKSITKIENLPSEIKEDVETTLRNTPFKSAHSFHNSYLIASEIDGVEKVDGWISWKFDLPYLDEFYNESNMIIYDYETNEYHFNEKILPKNEIHFEEISKGILKLNMMAMYEDKVTTEEIVGNADEVWDFNRKIRYIRNSWNVYKDIHFDLTMELDNNRNSEKINYVEHSERIEPYKEGLEKEVMDSYLDYFLRSENGVDVINKTYIGKMLKHFIHPKQLWKMEVV
jgi:hypothetical protein